MKNETKKFNDMKQLLNICILLIITKSSFAQNNKVVTKDTTIIKTFNQQYFDGYNQERMKVFVFPKLEQKYEKIIMHYALECPNAGCDEYDRLVSVNTVHRLPGNRMETYEIARIITPGGKSCKWDIDVTDYSSLLRDSVELYHYVSAQNYEGKGLVATITFEFIKGNPEMEAYKIINLWNNNPYNRWIANSEYNNITPNLGSKKIQIDIESVKTKVKTVVSGHTMGYINKEKKQASTKQYLVIDYSNLLVGNLFYGNCTVTTCSNDTLGGIGWCPGTEVRGWETDITDKIQPGKEMVMDYNIEPASCCDAWYMIQSQIIFYRKIKNNSATKISRK